MQASDQVGKIKRINHINVADGMRESIVLNQVADFVQHPVLKDTIGGIYSEIMQESKTVQRFFHYSAHSFKKIGVIGMGMMGGSICKGIKLKDPVVEIGTVHFHSDDQQGAQKEGWIDFELASIGELASSVELLIIASPQSSVIQIAEEIACQKVGSSPLIVMDIASVKGKIVSAFERLTCGGIEFIATHPMAGKETSGFQSSQGTLFVHRPWAIVPHQLNQSESLDKIEELVRFLGGKPVRLESADHDFQTALISHLPAVLSKLYLDFVLSTSADSLRLAGPGFESFTRLGHVDREKRDEFIHENGQEIEKLLDQWLGVLLKSRGRAA